MHHIFTQLNKYSATTGLLLMACSACFLIEPRTTNPGIALPTMAGALPHQSLRKCPTGLPIA